MIVNTTIVKSDSVGAIASGLCLIHCLATPLIFVAQACSASCCSSAPAWWRGIDYVFLAIAFFAIRKSTKSSSKAWIKYALWISWTALSLTLLIQLFPTIRMDHIYKHVAALSLVCFHLYSLRYCQCQGEKCCV